MTLIDRYIIRQFLVNFVILLVVIMSLVVAVDLIFQLDEFTLGGESFAKVHGGGAFFWTIRLIVSYYGPLVLLLFIYLVGLLVVAAMGFTFVAISRSGELVTMISGGISLYRVAVPILIAGSVINTLAIANQEWLIARMVDQLSVRPGAFNNPERRTGGLYYVEDSRGDLVSCGSFFRETSELKEVSILVADVQGRWPMRITADSATWNESRRGWDLRNGKMTFRMEMSDPEAAPTIAAPKPVDFYNTDVSPQVLMAKRAAIYPTLLSMSELTELLGNPAADRASILRIMHSRFSMVVLNVLILALVLPRFLSRVPLNPVKVAVAGAGIAIGSWMLGIGVLHFTSETLNPVVAAWLPVVIYLPLSAVALSRIKT